MKLAVISDIHSDLPSLEKALGEIQKSGSDRILCLGDIVGYSYHYADYLDGRDPDACVEMVRENCDDVICGNHDLHATQKLPSNYEKLGMTADWYDIDLAERNRISGGGLWLYEDEIEGPVSKESADYLRHLPESLVIKYGRFSILATHFIWPDITGSRKSSPSELKDFREHLKLVKKNKCLVGLAGHAHLDGYAQISNKAFGVNYFRQADLIRRPQVIVVPAITRSNGMNGYLILDTEKYKFEAIALD
ncbi:MAG: metallophosphoesterase [Bacteroidales bacterium]|nr:metallophosphoesterase [Bacteroidales bacterium]